MSFVKAIASFLSGLIGAMGFGGGGILIIYLVIFASVPQLTAQGINLAFFIPCSVISVIIYSIKKEIIAYLYNKNKSYFDNNFTELKHGLATLEWLYEIYKIDL